MQETQNPHQVLIEPPHEAETGNSRLRQLFKNPLESAAEAVTNRFPSLTASHITATGTLACVGAAVTAAKAPETARSLSWLHLAGSLTDALDGPVARARASQQGSTTTSGGANFDAANDRFQEYFASSSQAIVAFDRGDRGGGLLLLGFGLSSILPSLARSNAEANGVVVAEGRLGSRHSRVTLNCLGYFWNKHPKRVQAMAAAGTVLNLYNAGTRVAALKPGSPYSKGQINEQKRLDAQSRRRLLGLMTAGMAVSTAVQAKRSNIDAKLSPWRQ